MIKHLDYWWIFGVNQTGHEARIWVNRLWVGWKPIVAFTKRPANGRLTNTWLRDWFRGEGEDKRFHDWGQDIREALYWIEALCPKRGLVVDPFCGGGTIPLACKIAKRKWLATEVNKRTAAVARKRLAEYRK
jgi:methylase of polypeptide subunit release factors